MGDTNLLEDKIRCNASIKCQVRNCNKEAAINQPFCEFHTGIIKGMDETADSKERMAAATPEITPLIGANLVLR